MYKIHNKWDPLKVCMLGNNHAPEFFNGVHKKVADPLKRICEETLEDLEGYKNILQQFGVNVIQPDLNPNERFIDNPHKYPRGPLQPRDEQIVIGNKCFTNNKDHPAIVKKLLEYDSENTVLTDKFPLPEFKYNEIMCPLSGDWPTYKDYVSGYKLKDFVAQEIADLNYQTWCISSADSFLIDNRLLVGISDDSVKDTIDVSKEYIKQFTGLNLDVVCTEMDGHTDANFHPVKPGVILSLYDVHNYQKTFPGWDVCYLPDQSWDKVRGFLKIKRKNQGKWWLAGEEDNDEFTHFVETWLQDWVGYVEETVFDVNVLVLDEHHVCVNQMNPTVVNFLKKHNMEAVHVPWRHRYFWDGGLHCITLDLYRESS